MPRIRRETKINTITCQNKIYISLHYCTVVPLCPIQKMLAAKTHRIVEHSFSSRPISCYALGQLLIHQGMLEWVDTRVQICPVKGHLTHHLIINPARLWSFLDRVVYRSWKKYGECFSPTYPSIRPSIYLYMRKSIEQTPGWLVGWLGGWCFDNN